MAIEVFNRKENKFILNQVQYDEVQKSLLQYMELDEYNKSFEFYTISNIYYDTWDNQLIRNSISKPSYKEKLRLRSYGVPKDDAKVFLEIKKKVCGVVNKRRTKLKLKEAYEFVDSRKLPELKYYMNKQVLKEIEYLLKIYKVEPKLYLAYDRKALFSKESRDLRITFDTNIRSRRYDLNLERGDYGEAQLEKGQWLMEVKSELNFPLWLVRLLSEQKLYKQSFSKYGTEYERMISRERNKEGEKAICLNQYTTIYPTQQQLAQQFL
jgi:SPX domain protein involved in polyphosphate accumulation